MCVYKESRDKIQKERWRKDLGTLSVFEMRCCNEFHFQVRSDQQSAIPFSIPYNASMISQIGVCVELKHGVLERGGSKLVEDAHVFWHPLPNKSTFKKESPSKAVASRLCAQYQKITFGKKISSIIDPSHEELQHFCQSLRQAAGSNLVYFHLHAYGLPPITSSCQFWVYSHVLYCNFILRIILTSSQLLFKVLLNGLDFLPLSL